MIKNKFFETINEAEQNGASKEELSLILGKGRARKGIFEGDLDEGELEIGQASATIDKIEPVSTIMERLITEYNEIIGKLSPL